MKKKILLIVLCSFLLTGVVSAASLWGKYKTFDKVKVVVAGEEYKTTGVPPIVLNGQVMIPLNALKKLGISYTWDGKKYTAVIEKPKPVIKEVSVSNQEPTGMPGYIISDLSKNVKKINVEFVEYVSDGKGFNSLTFYYDFGFSQFFNNQEALYTVLATSLTTDATLTKVVDVDGNSFKLTNSIIKSYFDGTITVEQLFDSFGVEGSYFTGVTPSTQVTQPIIIDTTINSRIDGSFEGFEYDKFFILQNGQIWKQTSFDYKYSYKYSPKVTIYKDGIYYYMIVDGVDKKVKVEQIK